MLNQLGLLQLGGAPVERAQKAQNHPVPVEQIFSLLPALFGQADLAVRLGGKVPALLQMPEHVDDLIDLGAQVQANVCGDLVVAAAAGMKPLAGIADELRQTGFNVEMNVFEFKLPEEFAGFNFIRDLGHAAADVGKILLTDDAALAEHLSVRKRAGNVGHRHAFVEAHGLGVSEHELGHGFGKAARPCLFFGMQGIVGMIMFGAHDEKKTDKAARDSFGSLRQH